jgi:flagellar FliJ protein
MKKRSKRISAIADLEQHESDQAARALAASQQALRERESVLAELRRYREDYAAAHQRPMRQSIVAFQDYQRFLSRLDEAISHQGRLVADAQLNVDVQRGAWMAARSRALSLEKAVERCVRVEQRAEARVEQHRLDEAGMRARALSATFRS